MNHEKLNEQILNQFNLPAQFISIDAITNTYYNYEKLASMANWIKEKIDIKPIVCIICGSGLGDIAEIVENKFVLPYSQIPDFPRSTGNLSSFIEIISIRK